MSGFQQTPSGDINRDLRTVFDWLRSVATQLDYSNLKSGINQSDAKAVNNELYVDTNDDNTVKRGV